MTKEFKFVERWAKGEILTATAPADRAQLRKVLEQYVILINILKVIHLASTCKPTVKYCGRTLLLLDENPKK